MSDDEFDAGSFWSERLAQTEGLRATGHYRYGEAYNGWLYRRKAQLLQRLLPTPAGLRVLDVGSGTGWVVRWLESRGALVDGCDISAAAVERLAAAHPGSTFAVAAVGRDPLPFASSSYDVVTMLDVAYHVVDDDQLRDGLAEISRVLRPGGLLLLSDRAGGDRDQPAPHVVFRPADFYRRAAVGQGLRLVESTPLFRWISRPPETPGWRRLPQGLRGTAEYLLEQLPAGPAPFLRMLVFERDAAPPES